MEKLEEGLGVSEGDRNWAKVSVVSEETTVNKKGFGRAAVNFL